MNTRLLWVSVLFGALCACHREAGSTERRAASAVPPPAIPAAAAAPSVAPVVHAAPVDPNAASIYDLSIELTDDRGAVKGLEAFRGRPLLVTMFYAGCASACPLLTSDLKRIEKLIPEATRKDVQVLMVSFDAARDTPAVLARLKQERGMDPARWTLASTPDEQARELSGLLGIRYRKLDDGEFFHSSVIVLVDEQGRVRAKLDGLGSDPAPILAALAAPST